MPEPIVSKAITILYLYAPEDEEAREALDKHLVLLKKQGFITSWSKSKIEPGAHVANETMRQIQKAHIILLLISADFMSLYLDSPQMKQAQERSERREATIIPVLLRSTDWQGEWLSELQPSKSASLVYFTDYSRSRGREVLSIIKGSLTDLI